MIDDWNLIRRPSAWLPVAVSLAALVFLVGYVTMVGETGGAGRDEGAPARIFQLLMVAEAVLIVAFAIRWLPRAPRSTVAIVVAQVGVAAIPIAAVTLLEAGV
jgi:hypothetical protein